jgi:hypothetical protein
MCCAVPGIANAIWLAIVAGNLIILLLSPAPWKKKKLPPNRPFSAS